VSDISPVRDVRDHSGTNTHRGRSRVTPMSRRSSQTPGMFLLTYVRRELWHRKWQASFVACGLAVGIGLVVTVTAASAGVRDAQSAVLHALYGVGTDVTVTKAPPPAKNNGGGFIHPGSSDQHFDVLRPGPVGVLRDSDVAKVRHLPGVAAAAGGAILNNVKLDVPAASKRKNGSVPFPTSHSVDGVDTAHLTLGPLSSATLKAGRLLRAGDANADVAVLDSSYAATQGLHPGSTMVIAGKTFTIVGIVRQPPGGGSVDIYIPLGRAQALGTRVGGGSLKGWITTIYVKAASATDVAPVRAEIAKALPSATVTSSNSLASAVSGSLASAASLANDLGRWLAIAVLIAAFALASLLTMAAVGRRVREFGTLKALGWRSRLIVGQVLAESAVIGVVGAAIGVAIGFAGAALVKLLAPSLSATVAASPGSQPAEAVSINGSGIHHGVLADATHTVAVHLTAPVTLGMLGLAVLLAVAGALIAGSVGGYRAARLRPAEALGRLE
jgi:putative ABC transport system permease protein